MADIIKPTHGDPVFTPLFTPSFAPQTARLKLRQWKKQDLPVFAAINADPEVMEFYPATLGTSESNNFADRVQSLIASRGWGFWAVELQTSGEFIGFVGLHKPHHDLPFTPCVEIGWRLAKNCWGKGYATEAAMAALEVAFHQLDLDEVVSFTSVLNTKSAAVMQRLGMTNTGKNFKHPAVPQDHKLQEHVLYKITREEWVELQQKYR